MHTLRKFLTHLFWALLSLIITAVIILGSLYTYMELRLPNVEVLKDMHLQVPLRVYSRGGKLLAVYGAKRRIPVTLNQIPKKLIEAVLATEDARYYSHPGVDLIGLLRAAKAVIRSGHKVQGASTITMQVARNFFLTRQKTYARKIKEILLALKIDKDLSKDKVLELYLNKIYFGNRAYGVAAAAQVYYGKKLDQLTLPEMAMIAGLPQAPSANNPLRNPKNALKRRNHVLKRMLEVGYIDQKAYKKAIKTPLTAAYHGQRVGLKAPYVAEMVRQLLFDEYGERAYDMGFKVYTTISAPLQVAAERALDRGLERYSMRHGFRKPEMNLGWPSVNDIASWTGALKKISPLGDLLPAAVLETGYQNVTALLASGEVVTISWAGLKWARPALRDGYVGRAPQRASQIVTPGDVIWVRKSRRQWQLAQLPKVQGAFIALNPNNGAIEALVGGFDYRQSNFNRVVMAQRQPGSNFKPFVYSAALAKGYTLASIINDAPIVLKGYGEDSLWRPTNDTRRFYGPTRLRVGLTQSRNLVSIRLLQRVGVPYALKYIRRFGFNPAKLPHSLSLALGSGLVTPITLATGYAVFANGGYRIVPYFIQSIVSESGKVVYYAKPIVACRACITQPNLADADRPQPEAPQVLTPQNAYLMTQAMRGVIQTGTGRAAKVLKRTDLAGKTGTTNRQMDAWFSGFDSQIEATVWIGHDNMTSIHEYGAQAALPVWIDFMRVALHEVPEATMPQPAGMVTVRIDPKTGLLAQPDQQKAIFEEFRQTHAPKQFAQAAAGKQPAADGQANTEESLF